MSARRQHLLIGMAVLVASACARDESPTGPELSPSSSTADAVRYRVRDLGTLGGHASFPSGINRHGAVVGSSQRADGVFRGFLWQGGSMADLGSLGGSGGTSAARAINDAGVVVGQSSTSANVYRAYLWQAGAMTELFTPGGNSGAHSINNSGQIVGYITGANGQSSPALWQNGNVTDLGTLGGAFGEASDINDAGQIVGGARVSEDDDSTYHAFLWENGVMTDLGTLGGSVSYASGINADGVIVGWASTPDRNEHAVMWKNGRIIRLQEQGHAQSRAYAINSKGVKVGTINGAALAQVVWQFRAPQTLPKLGRFRSSVIDINDRGDIVGSVLKQNLHEHAVLWQLE